MKDEREAKRNPGWAQEYSYAPKAKKLEWSDRHDGPKNQRTISSARSLVYAMGASALAIITGATVIAIRDRLKTKPKAIEKPNSTGATSQRKELDDRVTAT